MIVPLLSREGRIGALSGRRNVRWWMACKTTGLPARQPLGRCAVHQLDNPSGVTPFSRLAITWGIDARAHGPKLVEGFVTDRISLCGCGVTVTYLSAQCATDPHR